jgi:sugar phosphate isomerase/epimerase
MTRLCLAHLTVSDLSPVEVVKLAAELGVESISVLLEPLNTPPSYSLINDAALRREMRAVADGCGVHIEIGEGVSPRPESKVDDFERVLDAVAELGSTMWNFVTWVEDAQLRLEQLAALTELAKQRKIMPLLEFTPLGPVKTVQQALIIVDQIDGLKLMVDPLHLFRGGGKVEDLLVIEAGQIGCAQLCDGPRMSESAEAYREEALTNRQVPGDGEFPLVDFVRALPDDLTLSPEVPLQGSDLSLLDRARVVMQGARRVLADAGR